MKINEPVIVDSKLNQRVLVDGHYFEINIVCTDQDPSWCLEVVDETGTSHCWEATFETDAEALEAATIALTDEGAVGFLNPNPNIIPFPTRPN